MGASPVPTIKMKSMKKFRNKIILKGGKSSNLNAPSTETPVSHHLLSDSLFPTLSLWGNKMGALV